jgi:hypothetical protein
MQYFKLYNFISQFGIKNKGTKYQKKPYELNIPIYFQKRSSAYLSLIHIHSNNGVFHFDVSLNLFIQLLCMSGFLLRAITDFSVT